MWFRMEEMIGKTFSSVENRRDLELHFVANNGDRFVFYHEQSCCESVAIEDIVGSLDDLVGSPLLEAEESGGITEDGEYGTYTWTYYKFGTIKGHVNIRWFGESNGYYSEYVDRKFVAANAKVKHDA